MKIHIIATAIFAILLFSCISKKRHLEIIKKLAHEKKFIDSSIITYSLTENLQGYAMDSDGDGIPDHIRDREINSSPGSLKLFESKSYEIHERINEKIGEAQLINSFREYFIVPNCPDSLEVNTPGIISLVIDFTDCEDSIDLDIKLISIHYQDTLNTDYIKKRIYKNDICHIARYLKIDVHTDLNSALTITPEPRTDEYVPLVELFQKPRILKWKVRSNVAGIYAYTLHVNWYSNNTTKSTIKSDEITTCPGKITIYEIPKSLTSEILEKLKAHLLEIGMTGLSFFLGCFGRKIWAYLTKRLKFVFIKKKI